MTTDRTDGTHQPDGTDRVDERGSTTDVDAADLPGDQRSWLHGIVLATGLWIVGILGAAVAPSGTVLSELAGFLMVVAWLVLPVSTYFDARYVRLRGEWQPLAAFWALSTLIIGANLLVVGYYLYRRYRSVGLF